MMVEAAEIRVATFGTEEQNEVIELVEILREATAPLLGDCSDPHRLSLLMTACSTFAGTLLGTLIIAGVAKDQDKKRVTESMAHNFRSGIEVGKRRAFRVAHEQFGGGNA